MGNEFGDRFWVLINQVGKDIFADWDIIALKAGDQIREETPQLIILGIQRDPAHRQG
ncbi:MAG: hypothetical protein ACK2T7_05140 [Anaerolineales bacterium]